LILPLESARSTEEEAMPHVQITWVAGRTPEQKRKLAERVTLALIEDGRAKRENIQVTFVDLPATDYAEAGVLVADQKRTP
jgi:4-oxalocrotonate tautomerase